MEPLCKIANLTFEQLSLLTERSAKGINHYLKRADSVHIPRAHLTREALMLNLNDNASPPFTEMIRGMQKIESR